MLVQFWRGSQRREYLIVCYHIVMMIFNFCPSPCEWFSRAAHRSVAEFGAAALIYPSGDKIVLPYETQMIKGFRKARYVYQASNEPLAPYSRALWMACGVWVEHFSPEIILFDKMLRLAQPERGNLRQLGLMKCINLQFQLFPLWGGVLTLPVRFSRKTIFGLHVHEFLRTGALQIADSKWFFKHKTLCCLNDATMATLDPMFWNYLSMKKVTNDTRSLDIWVHNVLFSVNVQRPRVFFLQNEESTSSRKSITSWLGFYNEFRWTSPTVAAHSFFQNLLSQCWWFKNFGFFGIFLRRLVLFISHDCLRDTFEDWMFWKYFRMKDSINCNRITR
jgi:hypothetical protein